MKQELRQYLTAGSGAGLFLFLLEAVDQSIALTPFFHSLAERLAYLWLLSATIVGGMLIGLLAAVGAIGLSSVGALLSGRRDVQAASPSISAAKHSLITILVLLVYAGLLVFIFKQPMENDLIQTAAVYIPDAVTRGHRSFGPIATGVLVLVMFGFLFIVRQGYGLLSAHFSRRLRMVLLMLLLGAILWSYRLDSRLYPGLHETTLHRLLFCFELVASLIVCLLAIRLAETREASWPWLRWIGWGVMGGGVLAIVTAAVSLGQLSSDESLRALFLHRSVMARRFVAFAQWIADRDGDGFSGALGGGDCDDANPAIHPAATEIPGNGRDENCLGGDLALSQPEAEGLTSGSSKQPAPQAVRDERRANIVLITVDALRADHLRCYGYRRETSPNIDRLAQQGTQFLNAYGSSTSTGHSFAALLKSSTGEALFDEERKTLMEILSAQGYKTAFLQHRDIDRQLNIQSLYRRFPKQGLDVDQHPAGDDAWTARELTERAVEYVDRLKRADRQFIWIHYYEPNPPYLDHPGFGFGRQPVDRYDSEIAYTDNELQRLFRMLAAPEIVDKTMVILTADHGEAFYEHGQEGHDTMPYQEAIRVPLIIRHPGEKAVKLETPVSLVDIAPTILRFAGIEAPAWYQGRDLFSEEGRARRPVYVETSRSTPSPIYYTTTMIDGQWKIIYDFVANTFEIYHLREDPGERRNLISIRSQKTADLRRKLTDWIDRESMRPVLSGVWSLQTLLK